MDVDVDVDVVTTVNTSIRQYVNTSIRGEDTPTPPSLCQFFLPSPSSLLPSSIYHPPLNPIMSSSPTSTHTPSMFGSNPSSPTHDPISPATSATSTSSLLLPFPLEVGWDPRPRPPGLERVAEGGGVIAERIRAYERYKKYMAARDPEDTTIPHAPNSFYPLSHSRPQKPTISLEESRRQYYEQQEANRVSGNETTDDEEDVEVRETQCNTILPAIKSLPSPPEMPYGNGAGRKRPDSRAGPTRTRPEKAMGRKSFAPRRVLTRSKMRKDYLRPFIHLADTRNKVVVSSKEAAGAMGRPMSFKAYLSRRVSITYRLRSLLIANTLSLPVCRLSAKKLQRLGPACGPESSYLSTHLFNLPTAHRESCRHHSSLP